MQTSNPVEPELVSDLTNKQLLELLTQSNKEIQELKSQMKIEKEKLKVVVQEKEKLVSSLTKFLNEDQMEHLTQNKRRWERETLIKGLKMRFALGVNGYQYIHSTGIPLPAYSTLTEKVRNLSLQYGVFQDLLTPLSVKVQSMHVQDRFCVISVDEMRIKSGQYYNKHSGRFVGKVTLGVSSSDIEEGSFVLVVLVRGIRNRWKQIVGAHITSSKVSGDTLKNFLHECITAVEKIGLHVLTVSSDMGVTNRNLWNSLGISSKKNETIVNKFHFNNHEIYVLPDACHILKNLKTAVLSGTIELPEEYVSIYELKGSTVDGSHIWKLWKAEIGAAKEMRLLYHLTKDDMEPDNFAVMHVGSAVRFFSVKTAAAIETAIKLHLLPETAQATAHFIRKIAQWFDLLSSRYVKTSITRRNKDNKYRQLEQMSYLFKNMKIGVKGWKWKPLNCGMQLICISLIDICNFLFENNYNFILLSRFSQDALENIFSQVRKRVGMVPNALEVLKALKLISISQFISDVKRTNYMNDSDTFLLDFIAGKTTGKNNTTLGSSVCTNLTADQSSDTVTEVFQKKDLLQILKSFKLFDLDILFNIGGSTTNAVFKNCCTKCQAYMQNSSTNDIPTEYQYYTKALSCGGLKEPSKEVFELVVNCEVIFLKYKNELLTNKSDVLQLTEKINNELDICFPVCCNIKKKIIKHYFTIRCYAVEKFKNASKKRKTMFGTASRKKKKC